MRMTGTSWRYGAGGRALTMTATLAAVLFVCAASAGSAFASSPLRWSSPRLVDHTLPLGHISGLWGVSCPSVSLCVAVGGNEFTSADPTGGTAAWRPTAGSVGGSAVSCPSVSLCVAVDGSEVLTSATPIGVAGSWKPAEVDGNNTLTGISCASVGPRVAVDASGNVFSSTDPTGGASAWSPQPDDRSAGVARIAHLKPSARAARECYLVLVGLALRRLRHGSRLWCLVHFRRSGDQLYRSAGWCQRVAGCPHRRSSRARRANTDSDRGHLYIDESVRGHRWRWECPHLDEADWRAGTVALRCRRSRWIVRRHIIPLAKLVRGCRRRREHGDLDQADRGLARMDARAHRQRRFRGWQRCAAQRDLLAHA
jgi:hypothetical protein